MLRLELSRCARCRCWYDEWLPLPHRTPALGRQAQTRALERLASRAATSEQQVRTQAKLHKQELERLAAEHQRQLDSTVQRVESEASAVIDELKERLRRRDTVRAVAASPSNLDGC